MRCVALLRLPEQGFPIFNLSSFSMQQVTVFKSLMQLPRFCVGLLIVILLSWWKLQSCAVMHRRRSKFKRDHECQKSGECLNENPIFGLDLLVENYRSVRSHALLAQMLSRYQELGANTYSLLAGLCSLRTIESEKLKAILSAEFTSFMLPPSWIDVFKEFINESIFA
jgi:hypothetical protein